MQKQINTCRQRPLNTPFRHAHPIATQTPEDDEAAPLLRPMQSYLQLEESRWFEDFLAQVEMHQTAASGSSRGAELDYASVNVYLLVLQQVAGVAAMCLTSTWAAYLGAEASSPLRTIVLTGLTGMAFLTRPILPHLPVPMLALHRALRWAGPLWLVALTSETLAFSACASQAHTLSPSRMAALTTGLFLLVGCALIRLWRPASRSDPTVVVAMIALAGLALVPQALHAGDGPLGHAIPLTAAAMRCARGASFAMTFGAVIIAATHPRVQFTQTSALVLRGLASSAWVLGVSPPFLMLVPPFLVALVYRRVNAHAPSTEAPSATPVYDEDPDDIESSSSEETDQLTHSKSRLEGTDGRRAKLLKMMMTAGSRDVSSAGTSWSTNG
jgi:hypothetical protein